MKTKNLTKGQLPGDHEEIQTIKHKEQKKDSDFRIWHKIFDQY